MNEREAKFRQWEARHRGIIVKVSRAYAWSPEDREDLRQEILVQLWRSLPAFRGDSSEATWVYRVALNTAMTWRRKARSNGSPEPAPENTPCPRPQPDESASDRELVEWLYAELALCSKVDRSLMLLHLDGVSYRDMAGILGISETNVGVKLNRLRRHLADRRQEADHGL